MKIVEKVFTKNVGKDIIGEKNKLDQILEVEKAKKIFTKNNQTCGKREYFMDNKNIKTIFIKEEEYKKTKKKMNKINDYFSEKELEEFVVKMS